MNDDNEKTCNTNPMSIDFAIEHAEEVARGKCDECGRQHQQLADWLKELKDLRTKYAYLAADFDNYKKRIAREKAVLVNSANRDVIADLLNVIDDMERLLGMCDSDSAVYAGFKLIYKNLLKLLDAEGCVRILVKPGDVFDVNLHKAVSTRNLPDDMPEDYFSSGDIAEIVRSGWTLNGKLLRPAEVVVFN